jgi:hypothetical protein
MVMRLHRLLLLLLLVALLAAASAADAAQRCTHPGDVTLSNKWVRVTESGDNVRACHRPTGRSFRLAAGVSNLGREADAAVPLALAGSRLAYAYAYFSRSTDDWQLVVVDVRKRRTVMRRAAFTGSRYIDQGAAIPGVQGATEAVLADDGTVLWAADAGERVEVRVAQRGAPTALLDDTPEFDAGSLALGERFAYWSRAGLLQRAALE